MPDRRGRRGSTADLIPDDPRWARSIWAARDEVARSPSGPWMLREAARLLGLPDEDVDEYLRKHHDGR